MKHRCAVIGQPPMRFPWGFDEEDSRCCRMKLEMAQRIIKQSGVVLAVYALRNQLSGSWPE